MISAKLLTDTSLASLQKKIYANTCLFNEGDLGRTMYVISDGLVSISRAVAGAEYLVGIPGPGEIIGERAILSTQPYRRSFTARAKTDCTVLEISADTIKLILEKDPNFHLQILEMVLSRLTKANHLIKVLQQTDPVQRFVDYVLYFDEHHLKKTGNGSQVGITVPEICQATVLEKQFVKDCVEECLKSAVFSEQPFGYVLRSPEALKTHLGDLRKAVSPAH